jgi:hypothetical protein
MPTDIFDDNLLQDIMNAQAKLIEKIREKSMKTHLMSVKIDGFINKKYLGKE